MAVYKPGRLRRVLTPIIGTMYAFSAYSQQLGTVADNVIQSVTIHRGKTDRGGGSHPSTMELVLKDRYSTAAAGYNIRFFMREPAAALLAAHLGGNGPAMESRFTGRLGKSSVEDTGKRFSTAFMGSSWISQMNYSPVKYTPLAGTPVLTVIAGLTRAHEPLRGIDMHLFGDSDPVARNDEPIMFREGIAKYAADIGILMQETRAGRTNVFGHAWRRDNALAKIATTMPLTRSQAISPAQWEQANERPPAIVNYKITNQTGGLATRTVDLPNPTGELRETVEYDWSHMQALIVENQMYREAYAIANASSDRQYRIPSITVDLLHLIGSPLEGHRKQAAQLLELEAGDPVFFSGDWPDPLLGIHFAEGITETITPESWTLELALVPYKHSIGFTYTTPIPARVWESANHAWDTEPRTWNNA